MSTAARMTGDTEVPLRSNALVYRALSALAAVGLILAVYLLVIRPQQLRWGATDAERTRAMPGDALSNRPTFLSTRAITIDATPADIWPWLVQIGYGRAGFYGYDILENLGSPRGIRSAVRIVPELQRVAVGDALPLSAAGGLIFNAIAPNEYLVWSGASGRYPGAFTWALYPVDDSHTRLVSRIQWSHHWTRPFLLGMDLFTEFTDHVAVRKILHGVKDRAEGRVESFVAQTFEFAMLLWALLAFVLALWRVLRKRLTLERWVVALTAGAAWLCVWYAPFAVWVGVGVNIGVLLLLRWSHRGSAIRLPAEAFRARRQPV